MVIFVAPRNSHKLLISAPFLRHYLGPPKCKIGRRSGAHFVIPRSNFRFHFWSQVLVPGFHFWFQFWARFWYPKLEPKNGCLIVFTLGGAKNGACFWNQKWTQNWHQKLKPRAQIWAISGPKTAQKLEPKMVPRHRKKNKNYRRPNIGIWETKIDYYFHPQKKPQPRQACRPKASTRSLFTFSFLFASTTMASLRCLTTASGVVAAAVERFATDAQCKQAWLW